VLIIFAFACMMDHLTLRSRNQGTWRDWQQQFISWIYANDATNAARTIYFILFCLCKRLKI